MGSSACSAVCSKEKHESRDKLIKANKNRRRKQIRSASEGNNTGFNVGSCYYETLVRYYDKKKNFRYNPITSDLIDNYDLIDQYTKDLAFGYINSCQLFFVYDIDNEYYKIKPNIYFLCLSFLSIPFSKESIDFESKLSEIVSRLERTDIMTRQKIWDKFDPNELGILSFHKTFPKILYAYIALYIKVLDRNARPPKYTLLYPLCQSISFDVKRLLILKQENIGIGITKKQYEENIIDCWKQIVIDRKYKK